MCYKHQQKDILEMLYTGDWKTGVIQPTIIDKPGKLDYRKFSIIKFHLIFHKQVKYHVISIAE